MSRPHPLGWPNAIHPSRSLCRIDKSKGRRQHPCSTSHTEMVEGFHLWRETEESAAEAATSGYATELDDYWRDRERPTFRAYLLGMRRTA